MNIKQTTLDNYIEVMKELHDLIHCEIQMILIIDIEQVEVIINE